MKQMNEEKDAKKGKLQLLKGRGRRKKESSDKLPDLILKKTESAV